MPPTLPKPVAAYFAADRTDGDAIAACFTPGATVVDERRTHEGRDAIRQWREAAVSKYDYTVEPFAVATESDATLVTARVAGTFPGSPVDLRYAFRIEGDLIAKLEIAP